MSRNQKKKHRWQLPPDLNSRKRSIDVFLPDDDVIDGGVVAESEGNDLMNHLVPSSHLKDDLSSSMISSYSPDQAAEDDVEAETTESNPPETETKSESISELVEEVTSPQGSKKSKMLRHRTKRCRRVLLPPNFLSVKNGVDIIFPEDEMDRIPKAKDETDSVTASVSPSNYEAEDKKSACVITDTRKSGLESVEEDRSTKWAVKIDSTTEGIPPATAPGENISERMKGFLSESDESEVSRSSQETERTDMSLELRKEATNGGSIKTSSDPQQAEIRESIYELVEDVTSPQGSKKSKQCKIPECPSPEFAKASWIKPEKLLEDMWKKKYGLRNDTDSEKPTLNSEDIMFETWEEIPELQQLKAELNSVKSQLDDLPLDHWHNHTKQMNIAQLIIGYVKKYFNVEFGSQAWAKMFEILCIFPVIPEVFFVDYDDAVNKMTNQNKGLKLPFDSIHLCEAPGAFISALNHFFKISYKPDDIDWNWLATTLNPYHEGNDIGHMINDDRLILVSMENWTFLDDFTGNILSAKNVNKLIAQKYEKLVRPRVAKGQKKANSVLLVTADGSVDCQNNPGEQEAIVASLQFGEIVAALMLLHKGGSFVLKIFTFLEAPTICHLYLLCCAFSEVHLFKPAVSKEGNSEVYVICLGYLGRPISAFAEKHLLPLIGDPYECYLKEGKALFPLRSIPPYFIDRIKEAAKLFCGYQMKIIKRNIASFPCDTRLYQMMKPFRKEAAEQWIESTEIVALKSECRLFTSKDYSHGIYTWLSPSHLDPKEQAGSFTDNWRRQNGDDWMKLQWLKNENDVLPYKFLGHRIVQYRPIQKGIIEYEKPYDNIRSSRLCFGRILSQREILRSIAIKNLDDFRKQGVHEQGELCKGHSEQSICSCMERICGKLDKESVICLCFMTRAWDFATKTDFEQQREDLNKVWLTLKSLEKGKSMFLCRFKLLTRLQAGLAFTLASIFEKVIVYGEKDKNVVGLFLYNFKGLGEPEYLLKGVEGVINLLSNEDEDQKLVLQFIPIKTLLDVLPVEFILRYNVLLLTEEMRCNIGTTITVVANTAPPPIHSKSYYNDSVNGGGTGSEDQHLVIERHENGEQTISLTAD